MNAGHTTISVVRKAIRRSSAAWSGYRSAATATTTTADMPPMRIVAPRTWRNSGTPHVGPQIDASVTRGPDGNVGRA